MDKSAQEDEILALKSIYEEEFSFDEQTNKGCFFVKIEAPEASFFSLNFVNEKTTAKIQHLPPILIEFEFLPDYPSNSPPKFQLNCRWLSSNKESEPNPNDVPKQKFSIFFQLMHSSNDDLLSKLCKKFDELWEESGNTSILFAWISFLTDDLFDYLKINTEDIKIYEEKKVNENELDKRAIKQPCSSHLIKNYDNDQVNLKFNNSYFVCKVCFTDKQGSDCMKFNICNHVFCNECMKGYFESQISSGNIKSLTCPQDKCDSHALQTQVLSLLGVELFNRYDNLLLKDSLNNMTDVVYCPRVSCQCPVIPEDTLAQCTGPNCNYVFCALCRQGYHGIEPCKITNTELKQICYNYKNGDEFVRDQLVKKYGEKRIKSAIEETSSMELIENTSKQCPQCRSWMQKLDGCNKMTCVKCHCYFCWLCKKILSKSDPYSHFNSANSDCFDKLFEGVFNEQQNDDNNDNDEDDFDEGAFYFDETDEE